MWWTPEKHFRDEPFETEADLEDAILSAAPALFGEARLYLYAKRLIGARGRTRNIPDGYLIDLSSARDPKLVVVENGSRNTSPFDTSRFRFLSSRPTAPPS